MSELVPSQQPDPETTNSRLAITDRPDPSTEAARVLNVQEENKIALDELGPMIINSDGTISRISNWNELTSHEQERTVRLLVKKRNLERLKKLSAENNGAASGTAGKGVEEPLGMLGQEK